ncbi:hypothetical protein [Vibrio vulnificus YJ016]|uniref:Uncharacterized protein n=1 Tax=Vibrio vulnificus (strain YJ016) TaxID=196600 RepID=Q7MJI9_VIBVY|nr:hypothetical protein [Vibrio vulnificus YJ016]
MWLCNGNQFERCSCLSCGKLSGDNKALNSLPSRFLSACLFRLFLVILAHAGTHPKARVVG